VLATRPLTVAYPQELDPTTSTIEFCCTTAGTYANLSYVHALKICFHLQAFPFVTIIAVNSQHMVFILESIFGCGESKTEC
jgi:hypothetical protein